MGYWGKIIGAIIGLAILKFPGAVLGLIIGHLFDVAYRKEFSKFGGVGRFFAKVDEIKNDAVFFHALYSALGHISKADGRVTQAEIQVASRLMDEMGLKGDVRKEAQQAFREGKARDFPLESMIKEFRQHCHGRTDILQIFLEILITTAFADGTLSHPERVVLRNIAKSLGFSVKDLEFLVTRYEAAQRFRNAYKGYRGDNSTHNRRPYSNGRATLEDAYKVLGIAASADDKSVKRAYKRLMAQNHPDKLLSKGLPQQALDMAKKKTQDIQAAYEIIKDKRGFS
ncbi:MAG: co-chaperone DjlA [Pseudomonadota bacterium]